MSKRMKIWLIVAGCLILAGAILFSAVLMTNDLDFAKLSTSRYETNTYTLDEAFSNIQINTQEADVIFVLSEDNTCKVTCYEQENAKHLVTVKNGSLQIGVKNEKKWYEYIGINFSTPRITVSLPQSQYDALVIESSTGCIKIPQDFQFKNLDISLSTGDVKSNASATENMKITTTTGNLHIENTSAKDINLTVSTGDIKLTNVQCDTLTAKGTTGRTILENVLAADLFSIHRSTGDIKLDGCDAGELIVKTTTGDITGSLLSDKIFVAKTSTGTVSVPQTTSGGKCEVITTTGDIRLRIG